MKVPSGERRDRDQTLLAKRYAAWLIAGVGLSVLTLGLRPLLGDEYWTGAISHGQLDLVALVLSGGALGGMLITKMNGWTELVKVVIFLFGLLAVIAMSTEYVYTLYHPALSASRVATQSYWLFAISVVLGAIETFLTYNSE